MYYAAHIDNPLMDDSPYLRTDVSATLFSNSPEDYQGGTLYIKTHVAEQALKLAAGSVMICLIEFT